MLRVTRSIAIPLSEIQLTFITSQGPGGQNVNKVATAVQLRFNIVQSPSLPEDLRSRILNSLGKRVTGQGEIIIKASRHRTQERNKQDALNRLREIIERVSVPPKKRKKTKPTYASKQRRLDSKKIQSNKKKKRQGREE